MFAAPALTSGEWLVLLSVRASSREAWKASTALPNHVECTPSWYLRWKIIFETCFAIDLKDIIRQY